MRYTTTIVLTAALAASAASAQTQTAGTVQAITVVGTSDLLANFLQATLTAQPGTALSSVNLRQVEQEVLATGYFKTAVAELRTVNGQDTLYITVTPNPTIGAVDATGLTFLPTDAFKKSIADLLNIAPGATLNTQRIDQAKEALAQNYISQGYPFTPNIGTSVKTNKDGSVTVAFNVDETAPISQVKVNGVTLLSASQVTAIFKPLYDARKFTPDAYYQAVQALQQAYDTAGYLQSGVNTATSTLKGGVLDVQVIEGKVAGVDLSDLGNPTLTTALQTQTGQPANVERLKADVRTLSNLTGKPVGFAIQPDAQNPGQVTVYFGQADVTSGPVRTINISGNTLVSTNTLLAALGTKVGDVYSPQLAQEDFLRLRDVYRKAGYEISTRDAITFNEGTLTYNIREVKLVGYELQWQGNHRTKDRVITRELPPTGQAFNSNTVNAALANISRLGFVRVTAANVRSDPQNPENVTYIIGLSEQNTGIPVNLALTYDSLAGGFGGEAGYSNPNVFGLGHNFNLTFGAQQNQAGQNLTGSASYTIPWLDLNFLDFRTKPTSLSVQVGSAVTGNNALYTRSTDTPAKTDTGWDYTQRNSYFSVTSSRNLVRNLFGSVSAGVSYKTYYLEPLQTGETGTALVNGTTYTYSQADATALLPKDLFSTRFGGGLNYDSTNNPEFPTNGLRGNLNAGYNFGQQSGTPLNWTDLESGASTYLGLGRTLDKGLGVTNRQQVVAVRVNYGTLVGTAPDGAGYYIGGGATPDASKQLRGIENGSLFGTNYVTASAEYRYDFNVKTSFAQGLYGVLFADTGTAWGGSGAASPSLNYGVGAGVQLNLGLGGVALPSLRFDYGYSPQNGSGKFYFRIGNFW